MEKRHKVLLVDDEKAVRTTYRELLSRLPSRPEIRTAASGAKAMAILEDEPYRLLICDLKMPKMDGLQVLSAVRRKYPEMRTVALTGAEEEQFRSRVYALGVDLFWHKPSDDHEVKLFLESLESLLGRDVENGFRGMQSRSLLDIVQLECMSQSSSVLRICNGPLTGRIWILAGEVVDAETGELKGEPAFRKIFGWRAGSFETLPAEPSRERTIFKSYNGLLLESAQVLDEARSEETRAATDRHAGPLAALAKIEGVEFLLARTGGEDAYVARGLENPARINAWVGKTLDGLRTLGDRLHAGPLVEIQGAGPQRRIVLAQRGQMEFCVGWPKSMPSEQLQEATRKVFSLWDS